ncbi:MAG: hypothetical protein ABI742_04145 [Gemmatimonadota bacterium]
MRRPILPLAALLPALLSCTAMGAWLYDDPSFALRSVTVRRGTPGASQSDSLDLVYVGCNRNDYDLLGEGFTALLAVGGQTIGEGARAQPILLATRDSSSFTVTVPLQREDFATHGTRAPFELSSHSMVHTPMGDRPVAFTVHGRVDLSDTTARWAAEGGPVCRPGVSQLPGMFDRRVPLVPPKDQPPRMPAGPGPGGNPTP